MSEERIDTIVTTDGQQITPAGSLLACVQELLDARIRQAEQNARVRTLGSASPVIAQTITTARAGRASENGGGVARTYSFRAWSTSLKVAWWRRGGTLYLHILAERDLAPRPSSDRFVRCLPATKPHELHEALASACPERHWRLHEALGRRYERQLAREGILLHEPSQIVHTLHRWLPLADGSRVAIVATLEQAALKLWRNTPRCVPPQELRAYLATPFGWLWLGWLYRLSKSWRWALQDAGLPEAVALQLTQKKLTSAQLAAELALLRLRD